MAETCRLRIYNKLHRSVFHPWKKHSRTTSHRSWKQWGWYSEWVYPPRTGWLEEDPTETLLGLKVTFWGAFGFCGKNFGVGNMKVYPKKVKRWVWFVSGFPCFRNRRSRHLVRFFSWRAGDVGPSSFWIRHDECPRKIFQHNDHLL